jgi:hypothetical protein
MPYYVRAFCKSESRPTIEEVEVALRAEYPTVRFKAEAAHNSREWKDAKFYYKEGKEPVIVELNVSDGPDSLAAAECGEFAEEIGKPGFSRSKARVLEHLRHTSYIISCQLLSDIDDDGYHLNGELLNYFVKNHGGIVQADAEGFYEGHKIIVKLK